MTGFWVALAVLAGWIWKGGEIVVGGLFFMPDLAATPPAQDRLPRISIIFGFRDEPRMEPALRSMLAQDYPDFEVIAVNDRSGDDASRALRAIGSPRLKVVDVPELPAGWLGKTHAVTRGYEVSTGEWIVFTDADIRFSPDTLRRAVALARKERLDHVVLFPHLELKTFWEKIYIPVFIIAFWMRFSPWMARFRWSRAFTGVGAFNMVRRESYAKIGTHAAFRLEIAEDVVLGKLIKEAGYRQMAATAEHHVFVRWAEGFGGIVASIRKNAFSGLGYSLVWLVLSFAAFFVLNLVPYAAVIWGGGAVRWMGAASIGVIALIYAGFATRNGAAYLLYFFFYPAGVLLLSGIVFNSAYTILRRGGVVWRDTFYPLEELKRHRRL